MGVSDRAVLAASVNIIVCQMQQFWTDSLRRIQM